MLSRAIGLSLAIISISAWAAPNLVENPGLEESDDMGDPAGWGCWGSEAGEVVADEVFEWEPEGHSGERSVSIREEGWGRRGWWYTIVRGVKPGRWHSVSIWAKRDRPTGWLPELELFGEKRVLNLYRVGVWEKFDWLLNSGGCEGEAVLRLVNWRKPYKVWFDDVRVEEFGVEVDGEAKGGNLSWRSRETGALVVFEVEASKSEGFNGDVRLVGRTVSNQIVIRTAQPFFRLEEGADLWNTLPKKLDLYPDLDEMRGEWYWRVKAFQNDTLLATSQPRKVTVEPAKEGTREVVSPGEEILPPLRAQSSERISFDENLNLLMAGKPFFPIGIYSLPAERFWEAKRAGFNTVLTDEVVAAQRAGLRAIVPSGSRRKSVAQASRLHSLLCLCPRMKMQAGTPALLGLRESGTQDSIIARYLWDEPDQGNISPREVFQAHTQEKTDDPHHPTAIVVYRPENFPAYASTSDILMTDPYPVPHRPLSTVSESVRAARKAVGDRKPVWAVIQAFDWSDASQEARRTGWARWPTFEEERCMAYLAVINGAKGILFFRFCGEGEHDPANWRGLKRLARELRELSPILMLRTQEAMVSPDVQPPDESGVQDEGKEIEWIVKGDGFRTYLIAANNWPGIRRATFSFERELGEFVSLPLEKRKLGTEGRSFSDVFEAYGVHVYELRFR